MQQFRGKSIGSGVAAGRILFLDKNECKVSRVTVEDSAGELDKYRWAKEKAKIELLKLYENAREEIGDERAAIFKAHCLILDDFDEPVTDIVCGEKACAEWAVSAAADRFEKMFTDMGDEYLIARCTDIRDVSERVIRIMVGVRKMPELENPVILVAEELTPSDVVKYNRSDILAFATRLGSTNSHTAILAREFNLPILIGVDVDPSWNGQNAVVDGYNGMMTINPDEAMVHEIVRRQTIDEERSTHLRQLIGKPSKSRNGKAVRLYANINCVEDTGTALENDAEGIGLFRSEYMYLKGGEYPSEELQFETYKAVAQNMGSKKVVIRTFDLGADKQAGYFDSGRENNPAMGYRAIRICLDMPDVFRTQLRAIFRASVYGDLAIIFPMIISLDEVLRCKKHVAAVKEELSKENIPFNDNTEIGVMIETPAAALISEDLAREVDFFSIGTNDLTQFTLAADRQNTKIEKINDPHHPAVLELIRMTVENGHRAGIPVGICGELAADTSLTQTFLDFGVDVLSVAPVSVLPVRKAVTEAE